MRYLTTILRHPLYWRRRGSNERPAIFRLKKDGSEYMILHRFKGSAQSGTSPAATLIAANDGKLYGFTTGGGSADGGFYRLDRNGSNYEIIFNAEARDTFAGNLVEAGDGMLHFVLSQRRQPRLYRMAPDGGEVPVIDELRDRSQRISPDVLYHNGALYSWTGNRLVRYVLPRGEPRTRVEPAAGDSASSDAPSAGQKRDFQFEREET